MNHHAVGMILYNVLHNCMQRWAVDGCLSCKVSVSYNYDDDNDDGGDDDDDEDNLAEDEERPHHDTAATRRRLEGTPGMLATIFESLVAEPSDLARAGAVSREWRAAGDTLWQPCCAWWPLAAALKARQHAVWICGYPCIPLITWRQLYAQRAEANRQLVVAVPAEGEDAESEEYITIQIRVPQALEPGSICKIQSPNGQAHFVRIPVGLLVGDDAHYTFLRRFPRLYHPKHLRGLDEQELKHWMKHRKLTFDLADPMPTLLLNSDRYLGKKSLYRKPTQRVGWSLTWSEHHNSWYWWNKTTFATTWKDPGGAEQTPEEAAVEMWARDPKRSDYLFGLEVRFGEQLLPALVVDLDQEAVDDCSHEAVDDYADCILIQQHWLAKHVLHQIDGDSRAAELMPWGLSGEGDTPAFLSLCLVRKLDGKCLTLANDVATNNGKVIDTEPADLAVGVSEEGDLDLCWSDHVPISSGYVDDIEYAQATTAIIFGRVFVRRCPPNSVGGSWTRKVVGAVVYIDPQDEDDTSEVTSVDELLRCVEHPSCATRWA
jgi:hypothetical protein